MGAINQSNNATFPTTDWGVFAQLHNSNPEAKRVALDILARRYWKPVFIFLKYTGHDEESAKDLTQAFFADWIEKDVFSKAEASKGRFRSFMLSCLKRFVSNQHRAEKAQKRKPAAGLVSLDELMDDTEMPFQPADTMTPELIFDRAWASQVVLLVLRRLEQECRQDGKGSHFDIFTRRIINPILKGDAEPSMADLSQEYALSEKQAANQLLTARRAYQRLLRDELRLYAQSEDEVSAETRDIFSILAHK